MADREPLTHKTGRKEADRIARESSGYPSDRWPQADESEPVFNVAELYGCLCHRPANDFLQVGWSRHPN
jgi:hypothetical protein